ncbi:hypothetical protein [Rubinisphaera italica]|uniref:hypothetical protein n=1 Tax=Rubinisphaera italica TaxID=2527969 RepID=UPI0011B857D8|nr:hypothetical protein [Rubinisphaera italica]
MSTFACSTVLVELIDQALKASYIYFGISLIVTFSYAILMINVATQLALRTVDKEYLISKRCVEMSVILPIAGKIRISKKQYTGIAYRIFHAKETLVIARFIPNKYNRILLLNYLLFPKLFFNCNIIIARNFGVDRGVKGSSKYDEESIVISLYPVFMLINKYSNMHGRVQTRNNEYLLDT